MAQIADTNKTSRGDFPAVGVSRFDWLMRYRYALLAAALIGLMFSATIHRRWGGDFWEHGAVVRELATHPLTPQHPQFALDAPHAFFSPYALGVAMAVRWFDFSPLRALTLAGLANLCLILIALPLFTRSLNTPKGTAFWTLIFALLLWGFDPWAWSGFLHLRVLDNVLPYPATFSTGLALLSYAAYQHFLQTRDGRFLLAPIVSLPVILICHPPTAVAAFLVLGGLSLASQTRYWKSTALAFAALAAFSLLAAAVWPYFPMFKLLLSSGVSDNVDEFHDTAQVFYEGILPRLFPALLGLPLLWSRWRANCRDPLVIAFIMLTLAYALGPVLGMWQFGRMLPQLVLVLQIAIAQAVAGLEFRAAIGDFSPRKLATTYAVLGIALLFCMDAWGIMRRVKHWTPADVREAGQYAFLRHHTGQYDVIIADDYSSWIAPTYGGKVVATTHPQAFVPSHAQRRSDLERFFDESTPQADRRKLVERYAARYILINHERLDLSDRFMREMQELGQLTYNQNDLTLFVIHNNDAPR